MPSRPMPLRALGSDWVAPRRAGRWTTIGSLDSPHRGQVDPAGLVSVEGATWSLDWWVGAEDRWHLPSQEAAARQSLVAGSPVVETRVRVPSGDAVHCAYGARSQDGSEALVVEVANESKVPFAVALAVRPHPQAGDGRIGVLELDGSTVRIDGEVALRLPRSPGRAVLSDEAGGDAAAVVFAGDAGRAERTTVACPAGLANGALLFPLAHTATLRVVLPLGGPAAPTEPAAFPAAGQVASGWASLAGAGARVEVPDRRLRDALVASTRHLLLGTEGPEVAAALDLLGFPAEAAHLLARDVLEPDGEPRLARLRAAVRHWELTRDRTLAAASVSLLAALVPRVAKDGQLTPELAAGAASLLEAVGEGRAAADVRAIVTPAPPDAGRDPGGATVLSELLASATSTWTWPGDGTGHDLAANAALVTGVRQQLVRDDGDELHLCPVVPDTWLGQGWELHGAPTRHGRLSYAVRWHGERPALLWELEPHAGATAPVVLRAPGLDPGWSSSEQRGEALLAPVAAPERAPSRGLRIPVSIEPAPGRPS